MGNQYWSGHKYVRKKISDFGHNQGKRLRSGPYTLTQFLWKYPLGIAQDTGFRHGANKGMKNDLIAINCLSGAA